MLDCREMVQSDLAFQKALLPKLQKEQEKLAAFRSSFLTVKYCSGVPYYYSLRCENGKVNKKYLNANMQSQRRKMQEIRYLDKAVKRCEENIDLMETLLMGYSSISPDEVVNDLGKAYQEQDNLRMMLGMETASRWKAREEKEKNQYEKIHGQYRPEGLKHRASDGTLVRTKSELAVKECLLSLGIPHIYEPAKYFDGNLLRPDFLAMNKRTGEEYYIEHVGYLVDEGYRNNYLKKLEIYARAGFTPNSNLLLTYDDRDGNIDMNAIMTMLKAYLK